jgi:hypothetical protein
VEIVGLLTMPVLLAFWMWMRTKSIAGTMLAFVTGTVLMLRLEQMVGGLQTELFGAVLGCAAMVALLWDPEHRTTKRIVVAGVLMGLSLFMKEPFLLAFLTVTLLLSKRVRDVLELFFWPVLTGGVLILVILFVTGWWRGYFEYYLPGMLLDRITAQPGQFPLFFRALWSGRLLESLTIYSAIPLLGYLLAGMFAVMLLRRTRGMMVADAVLVVCATLFTAFCLRYVTGTWRILVTAEQEHVSFAQLWAQTVVRDWFTFAIGMIIVDVGLIGYALWRKPRAWSVMVIGLVSVMLLSLAIGIGGYTGNDAAFAFPAYFAFSMLFLDELFHSKNLITRIVCAVTATLILITMFLYQPVADTTRAQFFGERDQYEKFSTWLDTMLTRCGNPTYAWYGGMPAMAYAEHSPIGPIFTPYFHSYLGLTHPLYQMTYENIAKADVMLVAPFDAKDGKPIPKELTDQFGTELPECIAQSLPSPIADVQVLYRKK